MHQEINMGECHNPFFLPLAHRSWYEILEQMWWVCKAIRILITVATICVAANRDEETLIALPAVIGKYGETEMCPYHENRLSEKVFLLRTRMITNWQYENSVHVSIRQYANEPLRKTLIARALSMLLRWERYHLKCLRETDMMKMMLRIRLQ